MISFAERLATILEAGWEGEGPFKPLEWALVRIVGELESGRKFGVLKSSAVPPQYYGGPIGESQGRWYPVELDEARNFFKDPFDAETHAHGMWTDSEATERHAQTTSTLPRQSPIKFEGRLSGLLDLLEIKGSCRVCGRGLDSSSQGRMCRKCAGEHGYGNECEACGTSISYGRLCSACQAQA